MLLIPGLLYACIENINPNLLKVIAAEGEQKASRALKEVSKQTIKCKKLSRFELLLDVIKGKERQ